MFEHCVGLWRRGKTRGHHAQNYPSSLQATGTGFPQGVQVWRRARAWGSSLGSPENDNIHSGVPPLNCGPFPCTTPLPHPGCRLKGPDCISSWCLPAPQACFVLIESGTLAPPPPTHLAHPHSVIVHWQPVHKHQCYLIMRRGIGRKSEDKEWGGERRVWQEESFKESQLE